MALNVRMNFPSHAGRYSPNWQTVRAFASLLLMLGLFILPLSRVAALEAIESPDQYTLPADMSAVHFYLITVDVGDRVWDNFGQDRKSTRLNSSH